MILLCAQFCSISQRSAGIYDDSLTHAAKNLDFVAQRVWIDAANVRPDVENDCLA